jgi:hypothetical protein
MNCSSEEENSSSAAIRKLSFYCLALLCLNRQELSNKIQKSVSFFSDDLDANDSFGLDKNRI